MFAIVPVVVLVQSPYFMVEEVVNNKLVNVVSQSLVAGILINSQSRKFLNSLQNLVFVINDLDGIEPTPLRLAIVF